MIKVSLCLQALLLAINIGMEEDLYSRRMMASLCSRRMSTEQPAQEGDGQPVQEGGGDVHNRSSGCKGSGASGSGITDTGRFFGHS